MSNELHKQERDKNCDIKNKPRFLEEKGTINKYLLTVFERIKSEELEYSDKDTKQMPHCRRGHNRGCHDRGGHGRCDYSRR